MFSRLCLPPSSEMDDVMSLQNIVTLVIWLISIEGLLRCHIVTLIFIPGFLVLDPEVFPWSCGIEIESNLQFKESSALGDSSKDSAEGSSQVEPW